MLLENPDTKSETSDRLGKWGTGESQYRCASADGTQIRMADVRTITINCRLIICGRSPFIVQDRPNELRVECVGPPRCRIDSVVTAAGGLTTTSTSDTVWMPKPSRETTAACP